MQVLTPLEAYPVLLQPDDQKQYWLVLSVYQIFSFTVSSCT
jgi:hypothetical protein